MQYDAPKVQRPSAAHRPEQHDALALQAFPAVVQVGLGAIAAHFALSQ